jgi:hypothetical protein
MGLAVDAAGVVFVADTGNHLIRRIEPDGTVITLAGRLDIAQRAPDGLGPLPGCPYPCLAGRRGYSDGNLTFSEFYQPTDVAIGLNNTVLVTDNHRVRRITDIEQDEEIYEVVVVLWLECFCGCCLWRS